MWMKGILILILVFIASFISLYVYEYFSLNGLNSSVVEKLSYSLLLFPLDKNVSSKFIVFPQGCLHLNASILRLSNGSYLTTYSNSYGNISYISHYPILLGVNFTDPDACKIGLMKSIRVQLIYENVTKFDGITVLNYHQNTISQGLGFPFLIGKVLGNQFLVKLSDGYLVINSVVQRGNIVQIKLTEIKAPIIINGETLESLIAISLIISLMVYGILSSLRNR
ncbi:hypothetical protein [Sulfolobus acidocaldarius]|nr:hypothetical protein [Sulfolobus acidocaldarius]AGE71892.1 hypothetical protein SacN8_09675 [Sulfolobus acidocaldarius N8]ALU29933.1 hypothetical protein ATY89_08275 [Sulfolobus acidocaldarius]ALU32676.1 hypothetical protein ATZ20_11295 [Sulfolobus acidocaldarius]WCM35758.1 hypothetical protein GO597_10670 [Sulfolobus acidocaldarius DSM 639]